MVTVRGKWGGRTSAGRQVHTALALALTFGAGQACGSRSMLNTDEDESGASGAENGGSAASGRGGTGTAAYGGSSVGGALNGGGSYGYGGTGKGGSGNQGGLVGKGGSYGKGGGAGYPMGVGGAYPGGGVYGQGGSYAGGSPIGGRVGRGGSPGKGGTYGKGGYGATGGDFYEGGAAGEAGAGGIAGSNGSPSVVRACSELCDNAPPSCPDVPNDYADCMSDCTPLSVEYPTCELEVADYIACVAANLSTDAVCTVSPEGECIGKGCTSTAQDACGFRLDAFIACEQGGSCGTGSGVGSGFCSFDSVCPNHDHLSECELVDSSADRWYCTCVIDGIEALATYIQGQGASTCSSMSDLCNLAR